MLLGAAPARAEEPARAAMQKRLVIAGPGAAPPVVHLGQGFPGASFENSGLKGAPFRATTTTEFDQSLADGNRIRQSARGEIARDGEGRTRREMSIGAITPFADKAVGIRRVTLSDPIAGSNWLLDPEQKTATRYPLTPSSGPASEGGAIVPADGGKRIRILRQDGPGAASSGTGGRQKRLFLFDPPSTDGSSEPRGEDLGTRNFDGVLARGTRHTTTIPVGRIGNERPLQIVDERWVSTELGITVMSRYSDPRLGTTTFRLTGIVRGEPDPALFRVPSDYRVKVLGLRSDDGPTIIERESDAHPRRLMREPKR
jgi:hypothetical protein